MKELHNKKEFSNSFIRKYDIIRSLLDTDLYKLTMMQVVFEKYTNVDVRYDFKCRNANILDNVVDWKVFVNQVIEEVQHLCSLRFTESELEYLSYIRFLKPAFIEYLRLFQLNPKHVHVDITNNDLSIVIEGPWLATILFEVPILAIVSELYSQHYEYDEGITIDVIKDNSNIKLAKKIKYLTEVLSSKELKDIKINDMGTRRRFSFENQLLVLKTLVSNGILKGTSNVYFAKELGIKAIGTMAHEYICAHQQLVRVEDSQKAAFQAWADVYRGDLGIALSDTVGFDAFLRDFDLYFAKLFDGCRHDSGDPATWCQKLIAHYKKLNIEPKTKYAVFSDGLDFRTTVELYDSFNAQINVAFGIGTNLTNDVGIKPLQIVIKMTECNGRPVAKISDSEGKGMCRDKGFEDYIKSIFLGR